MSTHNLSALFVLVLSLGSQAADSTTTLGTRGKLLFEEKFEGNQLPRGWIRTVGAIALSDGALRLNEMAADKHAGAFRKPLAVQNVAVQFDFKFEGAKFLHIGFDPVAGQVKKKGHLYSVVVSRDAWSIVEHPDKSTPGSRPVNHALAKAELKPGKWYTLLLENKGSQVVVHMDGRELLKANSSDFAAKKPGLVFRVGSSDTDAVFVDNIRVWELE